MPRRPRLHFPGGFYHVMLRGNHREALFGTAADRHVLNSIVADAADRSSARIHAFCWMTNHLHGLVQVSDKPLGALMQRIAQRYSRYRHKRLGTTGHLFERRYNAKLVDADAYFLVLLRYIHLNPVKARLVGDVSDFPWSSHRAFLGIETMPWVTTNFGLSLFSNELSRARVAYAKFMSEPVDDDEPDFEHESHPEDSRILGKDNFISNLPPVQHLPTPSYTLGQLADIVAADHEMTVEILRSPLRTRATSKARVAFAGRAVAERIATLGEVARFLHRNPSSLTRLFERHGVAGKWQR